MPAPHRTQPARRARATALAIVLLALGACQAPPETPEAEPPATEAPEAATAETPLEGITTDEVAPDAPVTDETETGAPVMDEAAPPEVAALPPPEPAPPPPPPPEPVIDDNPDRLIGLSRGDVRDLLGTPALVRREAPAEIWQYLGGACVFDVFLYETGEIPRVDYVEARDDDGHPIEARACLNSLLRARLAS